jgi:hypothetical protein
LVAAVLALGLLGGCEASRTIADYEVPDSPAVDAAAYPRLADGFTHSAPPPPGPDTAIGAAVTSTLTAEARANTARAAALAGPVTSAEALRAAAAEARAGRR